MSTEEAQKSPEAASSGISRRSITKGALWATPVVMLATAAPAAAYEPLCACTNATASATLKQELDESYTLEVTLHNSCTQLMLIDIVLNGFTIATAVIVQPGADFTITTSLSEPYGSGTLNLDIQARLPLPGCSLVPVTITVI